MAEEWEQNQNQGWAGSNQTMQERQELATALLPCRLAVHPWNALSLSLFSALLCVPACLCLSLSAISLCMPFRDHIP